MRLEEHVKRVTLDHHAYMGAVWWYSDRRWQALPEDLRGVVAEGFVRLKATTREIPKRRQAEAFERFKAAGGEIIVPTPDARAEFQKAASGMRDWFSQNYGSEWLDKLDAAAAACAAAPG
jgi:TRAP-type C4-dicarboxylate transport system substrate-binding protein